MEFERRAKVANLDHMKFKAVRDEDPQVLLFEHQQAWEAWLTQNHQAANGVWLRIAKKGSKIRSLTHAEALESALCFGWIDAHKRPESASAWLQRFTPRGQRSIWSKINRQKATALIACGRMRDSGLKEVLRAKKDGRWERAYDSPRNATVPEDFQAALDRSARAKAFFATLESRNRYAILFRIQTVKKAETRARKIANSLPCWKGTRRYILDREPKSGQVASVGMTNLRGGMVAHSSQSTA